MISEEYGHKVHRCEKADAKGVTIAAHPKWPDNGSWQITVPFLNRDVLGVAEQHYFHLVDDFKYCPFCGEVLPNVQAEQLKADATAIDEEKRDKIG